MSQLDALSESALPVQGTALETNRPSVLGVATAKPVAAGRYAAIDFTKGALVLIMVLYHWINYFVGVDLDYRYLRFLTPSFIFVTGFLIAKVYIARARTDPWKPSKRLFTRGLKLFAVFVALNLLRTFLLSRFSSSAILATQLNPSNLWTVFVSGNDFSATGKILAFYILVPISYLLILSAGLLILFRYYKYTFQAMCGILLLCIPILDWNHLQNANVEFVAIGLLGSLLGFVSIEKINALVRHPTMLAVGYLAYLVAITFYNVPFVLLVIGTCLSVMIIYLVGLGESPNIARSTTLLLGKYSLFGYVAQIAILQFLSMGLRHYHRGLGVRSVSFVAAFALTILAVQAVDWLNARSSIANSLYKAVFA